MIHVMMITAVNIRLILSAKYCKNFTLSTKNLFTGAPFRMCQLDEDLLYLLKRKTNIPWFLSVITLNKCCFLSGGKIHRSGTVTQ